MVCIIYYEHLNDYRFRMFWCVGFLSPTQYLKMKRSKQIELLPITPVFVHPKNVEQKPGYFADVIVHTDVGLANPQYQALKIL